MKRALLVAATLLSGCPANTPPIEQLAALAATSSSSASLIQSGISISIVIDTSGSMAGDRLSTVKNTFKEVIKSRICTAKEPVEYSIINCGQPLTVITPITLFNKQSLDEISQLNAEGGTPLGEAVFEAYSQLSLSHRERKCIFILTDGMANGSYAPEEIVGAMQDRGLHTDIYLIGFQSQAGYYQRMKEHGVTVLMVEDAKSLENTCDLVFEQILKVEND